MSKTDETVRREFDQLVNMTAAELDDWLAQPKSEEVGQGAADTEPVGHASGRRIREILGKSDDALDAEDHEHMRRVISYIKRHSAQPPQGDVADTRWRYSLMNWGHDPLKPGGAAHASG